MICWNIFTVFFFFVFQSSRTFLWRLQFLGENPVGFQRPYFHCSYTGNSWGKLTKFSNPEKCSWISLASFDFKEVFEYLSFLLDLQIVRYFSDFSNVQLQLQIWMAGRWGATSSAWSCIANTATSQGIIGEQITVVETLFTPGISRTS